MALELRSDTTVFVVGAGIMGAGIAQVAAQAGHPVRLFDTRDGAAPAACAKLAATLAGLVAKGKIDGAEAKATLARISAAARLDDAAGCGLVVEAIVENADAKRALFRDLEAIVGDDGVLASNTSSISITALANGLKRPGRLVGMHFFNPVPLMKLVEVVSGLQTDADVAAAIFELSRRWGKTPVHARSTPGFIVNRIARPYYAEALALLHERRAEPATIDACLRGAGFRMGPCELMDLIGHDTNFAVTQSVYDANFGDKRYVPSLVQREMVDGGLLGRKSGRGFFAYGAEASATTGGRAGVHGAARAALARSSRCTGAASPSSAGRPSWRRPASASRPTPRAAGTACRPTPASCASATAVRRRRWRRTPAFASSPSSTCRSRPAAAHPARRSRWRSRRPPRPYGASRRRSGCGSPAGSRSRSATRPASSSRAPSRC